MAVGLAQVFYYEYDSRPLQAREIRELWGRLSVLNLTADAYVHQDLKLDSIPRSPTRIKCGDVDAFDKHLPDRHGSFLGGFDCQSSDKAGFANTQFCFRTKTQSRWKGIDTLPNSTLFMSENLPRQHGWQILSNVFLEHMHIADSSKAILGCFDVGFVEQILSGMVFESIVLDAMPFSRWVEQALWVSQGRHPIRVRNLYWGNYFGSDIRHRLDAVCEGNFFAAYDKQARYVDGERNSIMTELSNGVFVSVSLTPMDCFPGARLDMSTQSNLIWLATTLRRADLL